MKPSEKSIEQRNMELMQTLDDSWNAGPGSPQWETFKKHHAENVAVYWPGGAPPTIGRHNHDLEAIEFFKTFPDQHVDNRPYKILFASGDYTTSVARFTGTFSGPMKTPDGKVIPPTNKKFEVEFATIAHWNDKGEILEERLFYDLVGFMKQIGLS
jgi:hypothetical protein